MHLNPEYEDIRPYADHEVQHVLERVARKASFQKLMAYLFPDKPADALIAQLAGIQSVHQLQKQFVQKIVRSIIHKSITDLTFEGLDQLEPDQSYLFISNHRDIILDPALVNVLLFEHGFETAHIAIGDNLLFSKLVSDLMRLNKSFVVQRALKVQDRYDHSLRLSSYIRHVIRDARQPVWIAQGNGRTKDGNDHTLTALLKMLHISGSEDFQESFRQLRIVPVSISYEFDPCDLEKARECLIRFREKTYVKAPEEDKRSMIMGIRQPKGRVHLHFSTPLDDALEVLATIDNKNERFRQLALLIDKQIHKFYRLWPTHYVAADLLYDSDAYASHYTPIERSDFERYLDERLAESDQDAKLLRDFFLQIYANPVTNCAPYHLRR